VKGTSQASAATGGSRLGAALRFGVAVIFALIAALGTLTPIREEPLLLQVRSQNPDLITQQEPELFSTEWFTHPLEINPTASLTFFNSEIADICIVPESGRVWICGKGGLTAFSDDHARTWKQVNLSDIGGRKADSAQEQNGEQRKLRDLTSIHFFDRTHGMVVGRDGAAFRYRSEARPSWETIPGTPNGKDFGTVRLFSEQEALVAAAPTAQFRSSDIGKPRRFNHHNFDGKHGMFSTLNAAAFHYGIDSEVPLQQIPAALNQKNLGTKTEPLLAAVSPKENQPQQPQIALPVLSPKQNQPQPSLPVTDLAKLYHLNPYATNSRSDWQDATVAQIEYSAVTLASATSALAISIDTGTVKQLYVNTGNGREHQQQQEQQQQQQQQLGHPTALPPFPPAAGQRLNQLTSIFALNETLVWVGDSAGRVGSWSVRFPREWVLAQQGPRVGEKVDKSVLSMVRMDAW
jgi:hypothetical protein